MDMLPNELFVILPRVLYEGVLERLDQIQSLTEGTPHMPERRIHAEMIGMIAALQLGVVNRVDPAVATACQTVNWQDCDDAACITHADKWR